MSKLNYRQACPSKKIAYSLLSRIDYDAFLSDMFSLPLFTDKTDNIDELLSQYNDGLSILLETHNLVLKKSIVLCLDSVAKGDRNCIEGKHTNRATASNL